MKMSAFCRKPFAGDTGVKLNLSNYTAKGDVKGATGVNLSNLGVISDVASLKDEVDKIDIEKLKTVPVDLIKLSNVVNNEVAKKTVYNKFFAEVDAIDTSGFVLKATHDTDRPDLEKET